MVTFRIEVHRVGDQLIGTTRKLVNDWDATDPHVWGQTTFSRQTAKVYNAAAFAIATSLEFAGHKVSVLTED